MYCLGIYLNAILLNIYDWNSFKKSVKGERSFKERKDKKNWERMDVYDLNCFMYSRGVKHMARGSHPAQLWREKIVRMLWKNQGSSPFL